MPTYYPSTPYPHQFINPDNSQLASGFVIEAYEAGTTTPTNMFTDKDGTVAGTSITLNSAGTPEVSGSTVIIWLQYGVSYKFILKDNESNQEWTVDDIGTGAEAYGSLNCLNVADMTSSSISLTTGESLTETQAVNLGLIDTGVIVRTAYYSSQTLGGGAEYSLRSLTQARTELGATWTPDGIISFYAFGGTTYVLTPKRDDRTIYSNQAGMNVSPSDVDTVWDAIVNEINEGRADTLYINSGHYFVDGGSVGGIKRNGTKVIGLGNVIFENKSTSNSSPFRIQGDGFTDLDAPAHPLTANLARGSYEVTLSDATGYSAGDWVYIGSLKSVNSSGSNDIPVYKQWFQIRSISGNVLTMTTQAKYTFNVADNASISPPGGQMFVGGVCENIEVRTNSLPPYTFTQLGIFNCTFNRMRIVGQSAGNFIVFAHNVVMNSCLFYGGFNGFSSARGCGSITYNDPVISPRADLFESGGLGAFLEESTENITLNNPEFINCGMKITSASDNLSLIRRQIVINEPYIDNQHGIGIEIKGYYGGKPVELNGGFIRAEGASADGMAKALIAVQFANGLKISGTNFESLSSDAYVCSINGSNANGDYRIDNITTTNTLGKFPINWENETRAYWYDGTNIVFQAEDANHISYAFVDGLLGQRRITYRYESLQTVSASLGQIIAGFVDTADGGHFAEIALHADGGNGRHARQKSFIDSRAGSFTKTDTVTSGNEATVVEWSATATNLVGTLNPGTDLNQLFVEINYYDTGDGSRELSSFSFY
jgi:hypothetical protein